MKVKVEGRKNIILASRSIVLLPLSLRAKGLYLHLLAGLMPEGDVSKELQELEAYGVVRRVWERDEGGRFKEPLYFVEDRLWEYGGCAAPWDCKDEDWICYLAIALQIGVIAARNKILEARSEDRTRKILEILWQQYKDGRVSLANKPDQSDRKYN